MKQQLTPRALAWLRELVEFDLSIEADMMKPEWDQVVKAFRADDQGEYQGSFPIDDLDTLLSRRLVKAGLRGSFVVTCAGRKAVGK